MQDLPRTFPGHPWLDTPEGHATLRRVLVGYSFRDSDVGYCQVDLHSLKPLPVFIHEHYLILLHNICSVVRPSK